MYYIYITAAAGSFSLGTSKYETLMGRLGTKVLSPETWRRNVGADVLAPMFWRRSFCAEVFQRHDVLAPICFGVKTVCRRRFGAGLFDVDTFWCRNILAQIKFQR